MKLPGMLHAIALRSPYAHAKINSINLRQAMTSPGVKHIYTSDELVGRVTTLTIPEASGNRKPVPRPPLARGTAKYVGDPIAFIIAESKYLGQDATERLEVDYSPIESLVDPSSAMNPASPKIHESLKDNLGNYFVREAGDIEEAFRAADRIVKVDLVNQRCAPSPMEPRAVLASDDPGTGNLTVWMSNQQPFETRSALAEVLRMAGE